MADRIIVLGMHPATVHAVIENKIPRPRDYHSPDFLKLVEELHDTYGRIEPLETKRAPKKEKITPLLAVSFDEILGFLGYLNRRDGSQNIFKIGAESNLHYDKITPVLHATKLLNFVEIDHRTVSLTEKGKEFLEENPEKRKALWKTQLLTIPLFQKVCELLKKAPGQTLSREELIAFLAEELPYQDPHAQLHTLIRWGERGNLFAYHKKTKHMTLRDLL